MMNLFIDTEFTSFDQMTQQIISLGIVSEDGSHEFYVENTSHLAEFRSDYVQKVIVPMLDYDKYGRAYPWACLDLHEWIEKLPDDKINIIVDYSGDWNLVKPMLDAHPTTKTITAEMYSHAFLRTLRANGVITEAAIDDAYRDLIYNEEDSYFKIDNRQHHALVDAKSNRHVFLRALQVGIKSCQI